MKAGYKSNLESTYSSGRVIDNTFIDVKKDLFVSILLFQLTERVLFTDLCTCKAKGSSMILYITMENVSS